ncbi:Mediator of RNA polymerase II transcription subunit 13 [Yarrowia sp. C11]|nr:Mediator of RNA polymerase II transcription subunit 13 [Yarrowia sp. C11]
MFLNLSKAQSNVLFVGKYTTIPYRTYICLQGNETSLQEAEWAIRNDNPRALVKSYNKELWTFSLQEGVAPPSALERFQLTETSTGVFLPSTTTPSSLTMAKQLTPPGYVALMLAIEAMIQEALKRDDHYVPFGNNLILPATGDLLHLDARLTPGGDLLLQMYQQETEWEMFGKRKRDVANEIVGTKVVVAPTLVEGVVENSTNQIPDNLPTLLEMLDCLCNVRLRAKKQWTAVRIDKEVMLWPTELLFVDRKTAMGKLEDETKDALSWTDDILDSVFEATQLIRRGDNGTNNESSATQPQAAHNGSTSTTPAAGGTATAQRNEENKQIYPTPPEAPKRVDEAVDFAWDTPGASNGANGGWGELDEELFGGDEVTEADFNFFDDMGGDKNDTDGDNNDNDNDKAEDAMDVDIKEESIKEEPKKEVKEEVVVKEEVKTEKPDIKTVKPDASETTAALLTNNTAPETAVVDGVNDSSTVNGAVDAAVSDTVVSSVPYLPSDFGQLIVNPAEQHTFAQVEFNREAEQRLNDKYAAGGRFFVPDDSSSVEDGSSDNMGDSSDSGDGSENVPRELKRQKVDEATLSDQTDEPEVDAKQLYQQWSAILNYNHKDKPIKNTDTNSSEVANTNNNNNSNTSYNNTNYEEAVQRLAEQVVWDNSCYKGLVPRETYYSPPSVRFVKVVEQVFGDNSKRLSLIDFAKMSDKGGQQQPGVGMPINAAAAGGAAGGPGTPATAPNANGAPPGAAGAQGNQMNSLAVGSAHSPSRGATPQPEGSSPEPRPSNWTPGITSQVNSAASSPVPLQQHQQQQQQSFSPMSPQTPAQAPVPSANSFANAANAAPTQRLATPMYSFMRGGSLIKAQPPILRFWSTFGLSPRKGPKPLTLTLVYPSGAAMGDAAAAFLISFKMCYEGCGFGLVTLGGSNGTGVVSSDYKNLDVSREGVLLVSNPYNDVLGFLNLAKATAAGSKTPASTVLTLPCSIFASCTSLRAPSSILLAALCRNLYDHLPPTSTKRRYGSIIQRQAPACVIAKPVPPFINFKLLANTPDSVINEDSLLHVAYAASNRWITCAWSDQWGELAKVKVFCLQSESGPLRTLEEVCTEIWETTLQLNGSTDVRSVAVAKLGGMLDDELAMWLRVSSVTRGRRITPFFLVVDKRPSMVVTGSDDGSKGGNVAGGPAPAPPTGAAGALSTGSAPMSTPFRDTDSPDIYNHVTTPSVGEDKIDYDDMSIVDVHDEIHSVTLNHRQPLTMHSTRLGLATGYLVKTSPQNPNQLLVFSLTFVNCPCVVMHVAMKHFLRQYRNLISLAATTGVCEPEYAIVPWHVEAADKMMRLVEEL